MSIIDIYLAHLVDVIEGPEYTNDPNDSGGPTKYGITLRQLASYRKTLTIPDDVKNLTREEAIKIYTVEYVNKPGFNNLIGLDNTVALECIDTGVNMGQYIATVFLQRALNSFSNNGTHWSKVSIDGICGAITIKAVQNMRSLRGQEGMNILTVLLNCMQGNRYLELVEDNAKDGKSMYGWIKNRIQVEIEASKYGVI